jgi:RNA polymerase sigma-70 factor (family 1)
MSGLGQKVTDIELWNAIREGNEAAFRMLYDRYWPTIYSTAWSYLHDRQACTEIVQTIFLGIWMRRHELKIGAFYPYLKAAARYQVYNRLQKKGEMKVLYFDSLPDDGKSAINEGEFNLSYRELQDSVENHLQDLPQRCRDIFLLSRKEHLSITEIAQRLGISKRTVENQLTNALQHLRHELGDLSLLLLLFGWYAYAG